MTLVDIITTQTSLLFHVFIFCMFLCQSKSCLCWLVPFLWSWRLGERRDPDCTMGNTGQDSRIMDMGIGSVLGKVSCLDKLLRDSWNGNGVSQSIRRVKPWGGAEVVMGEVGGWTEWWYFHHCSNPPRLQWPIEHSEKLTFVWPITPHTHKKKDH